MRSCWEVNTGRCRQELNDDRWAQVTALDFLQEDRHLNLSPILFIGTARGVMSMYPFSNASKVQLSHSKIFQLLTSFFLGLQPTGIIYGKGLRL